nr:ribonuclease H-like domain-containing protein [Tanacetum cinerariifolium]
MSLSFRRKTWKKLQVNIFLEERHPMNLKLTDKLLQPVMKGHFVRECRSPKDSKRNGAVEPQRRTIPRLARKNELKARGTLLMASPDKHQLKFNTHKDAKTLMEVIKNRFGGNTKTKTVQKTLMKQQYENFTGSSSKSLDQIHDRLQKAISQLEILRRNKTDLEEQSLDDLFNNLKIYEAEVKSSSSTSTSTQNIAFVSSSNTDSTNEPVSAAASVSTKINADDLEEMDLKWQMTMLTKINADDLEEIDLKWQMTMLTVECYNCHRKGHFAKECRSPKDTRRNDAAGPQRRNVLVETSTSNVLVSQYDGVGSYDWSFQADKEPTNYALMAFTSSSSSSDNESLEKAEQERDDLKLKLEKFQTSSKNLSELLASQTNDKTCLGYNSQVFTCAMFDCDDYLTSESDESLPPSPIYDRYQSRDRYHVVPPPYTGTFMPPKPDLVFHNAPNAVETVHTTFNDELSPTKPENDLSHTHRPSAPIIEDWVSNSEDEFETKIPQNVPSFVQPTEQIKSPRPSVKHVKTSILTANPKTTIPNPTSNGKRRNRKACFGNTQHALKDKGVIDSRCSRYMKGNMSYLSDFKELNGGYVSFGGNLKGVSHKCVTRRILFYLLLFPRVGSTTLNDKVIVALSRLTVTLRETLYKSFTPKAMRKLAFDDQEE